MKKLKLNYNDTFATTHSRDYYRGKSFHFSGKWIQGMHYISDDYNIDFVVHGQVLLACAKSHLSTLENEPKDFITDNLGNVVGIASTYWDFVLAGIRGDRPGIRINSTNLHWEICDSIDDPVWVDTGIKSKFEFSDLTEEELSEIQQPIINTTLETVENKIKQVPGSSTTDIMSQKAVTQILLMNDGAPYTTSKNAEDEAALSKWAGNISISIFQYNYKGQNRGYGTAYISQNIYLDNDHYYCKQHLHLSGKVHERIITLNGSSSNIYPNLENGCLPVISVGNWTDVTPISSSTALSIHQNLSGLITSLNNNKQNVISDLDQIRAGANLGATAYQKPETGIPAGDIAVGVIPDVSSFIDKNVDDLTNYYLKSETYTQAEVQELIDDIPVEKGTGTNSVQQKSTNVTASGASSWAEGMNNDSAGMATHVEGITNYVGMDGSKTPPADTGLYNSSSAGSHVEGQANVIANAAYSHVEGCRNKIFKDNNTVVKGSHAEGKQNTITGNYTHAEGLLNIVTEEEGHVEGFQTEVHAMQGHAEGWHSYVGSTGRASHAEGYNTQANGQFSHAEGQYTETKNPSEHAEGKYNKSNIKNDGTDSENKAGSSIHSVGIGTSTSDRKNAFEIMQNGDVYVIGLGGYDGTNPGNATPIQNYGTSVTWEETNYTGGSTSYEITITDRATNQFVTIPIGVGYSVSDKAKLNGIEAGAQVNKLENIILNNTTLTRSNKSVDIFMPQFSVTNGILNIITPQKAVVDDDETWDYIPG